RAWVVNVAWLRTGPRRGGGFYNFGTPVRTPKPVGPPYGRCPGMVSSLLPGCPKGRLPRPMSSRWLLADAVLWNGQLLRGTAVEVSADGILLSAGALPQDAPVE